MVRRAIIGGVSRHLDAWKPTGKRYGAAKPDVDITTLPTTFVLDGFPTDFDQGQLGSCGPNSVAECFQFLRGISASRLFLYYWTRATEGDIDDDAGVTIPDLLDVASSMGMPPETLWPYDITQYKTQPPMAALVVAPRHRVIDQAPIADLDHLMYELAVNRKPVMLGFQVPASMEDGAGATATTGLVAVPSATDASIGGHCVNAIGFDRAAALVRCTCHYGGDFGDHGTILLPFAHWFASNVNDMRAVRAVS